MRPAAVLLLLAFSAFALDDMTYNNTYLDSAILTADQLNEDNDSTEGWIARTNDTLENAFVRWVEFADSTIDSISAGYVTADTIVADTILADTIDADLGTIDTLAADSIQVARATIDSGSIGYLATDTIVVDTIVADTIDVFRATIDTLSVDTLLATLATIDTVRINGTAGIGVSDPDGQCHVMTASAGSITANTNADDLVVENDTYGGISILTPPDRESVIYFGNPTNAAIGQIRYNHTTDVMHFRTNAGDRVSIQSNGRIIATEITVTDSLDVDTLVANTATITDANIDGGVIDNTEIGGDGAAAGDFTTLTASDITVTDSLVADNVLTANNATIDTADIDGGAIDNTDIGGDGAAAGDFTSVSAESFTTDTLTVPSSGGGSDITRITLTDAAQDTLEISIGAKTWKFLPVANQ